MARLPCAASRIPSRVFCLPRRVYTLTYTHARTHMHGISSLEPAHDALLVPLRETHPSTHYRFRRRSVLVDPRSRNQADRRRRAAIRREFSLKFELRDVPAMRLSLSLSRSSIGDSRCTQYTRNIVRALRTIMRFDENPGCLRRATEARSARNVGEQRGSQSAAM